MGDPFTVFPELETERIRLQQLTIGDLDVMYSIKSNPMVTNQYGRDPHTAILQTEKWIEVIAENYRDRSTLYWKIVNKIDGRVAGAITLWNMDLESHMAEVGYELHPDFWRKGIMFETMGCLLQWAFEDFGLNRVEACPLENNIASIRLLERAGFKLEGTLRERAYFGGKFLDQYYYALLKNDWVQVRRQ